MYIRIFVHTYMHTRPYIINYNLDLQGKIRFFAQSSHECLVRGIILEYELEGEDGALRNEGIEGINLRTVQNHTEGAQVMDLKQQCGEERYFH